MGFVLIIVGSGLVLYGSSAPEDIIIHPSRLRPSVTDTTNIFNMSGLVALFVGVASMMFWILTRKKKLDSKLPFMKSEVPESQVRRCVN